MCARRCRFIGNVCPRAREHVEPVETEEPGTVANNETQSTLEICNFVDFEKVVQVESYPCRLYRGYVRWFTLGCRTDQIGHEVRHRLWFKAQEVLSVRCRTGTTRSRLDAEQIREQASHKARMQRLRCDDTEGNDGVSLAGVLVAEHNNLIWERVLKPPKEIFEKCRLPLFNSLWAQSLFDLKCQGALHDLQDPWSASVLSFRNVVGVCVELLRHELHGAPTTESRRAALVVHGFAQKQEPAGTFAAKELMR
mmetsp:Transcript_64567/g.170937  ORF Transcript_64567/g.170937 Transcript_64567/m.170937 type:complete len:252 (-) Transcript_64567:993-1748(-)